MDVSLNRFFEALSLLNCFREVAKEAIALLTLLCIAHIVSADDGGSYTVFDDRVACRMPFANINTSSAIISDRYFLSAVRCSMLCSTTVGCMAFLYSNSLQRCRLLNDLTPPSVADDLQYMIVSGGASPINIALYKPASASSQYLPDSFTANFAVDGKIGTIMHTSCIESYPWLLVDLQYVYRVTEVTVYASCHCCYYRMHDIDIRVGNTSTPSTNSSNGGSFFYGSLCYHRAGPFTTCSPGETYSCAAGAIGRYLTVQVTAISTEKCFHPSEVKVKGVLVTA